MNKKIIKVLKLLAVTGFTTALIMNIKLGLENSLEYVLLKRQIIAQETTKTGKWLQKPCPEGSIFEFYEICLEWGDGKVCNPLNYVTRDCSPLE